MIPRWRDFQSSAALGELDVSEELKPRAPRKIDVSDLEFDWANNRSLSFAGDLISGAWVSGNLAVAKEAAEFVLQSSTSETQVGEALLGLAREVLERADPATVESTKTLPEETRHLIAKYRRNLNDGPRDPIRWVDLSLLYAQRGLLEKAQKAMVVALDLAPNNRFILRSAARFFMHNRDPERAHFLLRKSPLLNIDPWITSAELAVAAASKRVPFGVDAGKKILSNARLPLSQTSELAAAFATLEFRDGNVRRSKKYLNSSLRQPNDNSLAQAQWLSSNIGGMPMNSRIEDFNVPRSYEALACETFMERDWTASISNSIKWLRDEPFARRPAQISSYTASLIDDYETAEKLLRFGLIANPHFHGFYISLAFGFASRGRLEEAEAELERIKSPVEPATGTQILANRGLIAFRRKNFELGRRLYQEAVEDAAARNDHLNRNAAMIYWAREEIRIGSAHGLILLDRVSEFINPKETPQYDFLIARFRRLAMTGLDETRIE